MTDVITLAGIAATLLKIVLRINDEAEAVDLIGHAQAAASLLSRLKRHEQDIPKPITNRIEKRLQTKLHGMYDRCVGQGIDVNSLEPVATEVAILLEEMAQQKSLLVTAARLPEEFPNILQSNAAHRRSNVEERLEPYFDDLVIAVAEEYAQLAPWSPYFQQQSFNAVFDKLDELIELGKTNIEITQSGVRDLKIGQTQILHAINTGMTRHSTQARTLFGKRPKVTRNFIVRKELETLYEHTINKSFPQTVLIGMRGSGKSQIASKLAEFCENNNWGLVAWLNASSKQNLKTDIIELAFSLDIPTGDNPPTDTIIQRCLDHLRSADADDRLIILDNVTRIDDLTDLIPSGEGLRVIATTTSSIGWAQQSWKHIEIGLFSDDEARNLLLETTSSSDHETAGIICELLGNLPLAIAQAAATAVNEDYSLQRYLARLSQYAYKDVLVPIPCDSYKEGVSKALLLTVESALTHLNQDQRKAAQEQLYTLAFLSQSGVPTRWLDPTLTDYTEAPSVNTTAADIQHRSLNALVKASVVQQSSDRKMTMLHRLQAQALREHWNPNQTQQALSEAANTLRRVNIDALPLNDTNGRREEVLQLIEQLRSIDSQGYSRDLLQSEHILSCLNHTLVHACNLHIADIAVSLRHTLNKIEDIGVHDRSKILVTRQNLAGAYKEAGRTELAIQINEEVLSERIELLGTEDRDTLLSRNNLAGTYESAGRLSEAIAMYRQLMSDYTLLFDADDPDTIRARNNLACALCAAGNLSEAIILHEENVATQTRILGSEDPDTLTSRNNLAGAYLSAGRLEDAIPAFELLFEEHIHIFGPDDPNTLTACNNLASAYRSAGRFSDAINLHEQLVSDCIRIFGTKHPDTLSARNSLACTYESAGRLHEAIDLFEQVAIERAQVLGNEHPNTLQTRNFLAGAYQSSGNLPKAIKLYEQVLNDRRRILGNNHPDTCGSQNNLATAYAEVGRLSESIRLLEELTSSCISSFDADYPNRLTVLSNLAANYNEAGRITEAIDLQKRLLDDYIRIFGEGHPETISAYTLLADCYESANNMGEAIEYFHRAFTLAFDTFYPDHPEVIETRNDLAKAYRKAGRSRDAIFHFEEVVNSRSRIFGPDDEDTLSSRTLLAIAHLDAGLAKEAHCLLESLVTDYSRILGDEDHGTKVARSLLTFSRSLIEQMHSIDSSGES